MLRRLRAPHLLLIAMLVTTTGPALADPPPPPAEGVDVAAPAEEPAGRSPVHAHAVRFSLGFGIPAGLYGLEKDYREDVFELGATTGGDGTVMASAGIEYRRELLAVRLSIAARSLLLGDSAGVTVFDGVEEQNLALSSGGGYFGLAALAGVQWEPTLYVGADGGEGLSLALSALGGHEHISLWGSFERERIPNFRLGERSFHYVVERQRVDLEAALRWRHAVGGDAVRHLLGIEAGLTTSLLVHVPYLSTASDPIEGVTSAWGSWTVFVRLIWELGLPDVG